MPRTPWILAAACGVVLTAAAPAQAAQPAGDGAQAARTTLGRQVLPAHDGWAAHSTGTTGGSAATPGHVYTVRNRAELVAALGGDNARNKTNATPKIIKVVGTVRANADDTGRPLDCAAYADPGYSLAGYLAAYDPATWGRKDPTGPLEDARARSAANQAAKVKINVGPNTTIVGAGRGARLLGGNLMLDGVDNVIVRNLDFQDAADCFPQWDPLDTAVGNWNSEYDTVSLLGATHVWVDHCTFSDGANPDSAQPVHFGRPYQVHDGLLDITRGSDLVTVSWNVFRDHDKAMLIGSTNNPKDDLGKLRVTLHHNQFRNILQRAPRVRFGQVHVYDNHYVIPRREGYEYTFGVGVQSQLYAENNYVNLGPDVTPDLLVHDWGGTALTVRGTLVNGISPRHRVDLVAAYNASHDPDLGASAGWTPVLHTRIDPTAVVPAVVGLWAGAGRIG